MSILAAVLLVAGFFGGLCSAQALDDGHPVSAVVWFLQGAVASGVGVALLWSL